MFQNSFEKHRIIRDMIRLRDIPKDKIKKWTKIGLVLLITLVISLTRFFILTLVIYRKVDVFKPGGVDALIALVRDDIRKTGPWAILVYILLRVVATVFLSFVPALSMTFDLICLATFSYLPTYAIFLICLASVTITSIVMDLIGRFGGHKAITKILGEEDYAEAKDLIKEKGMVYVPVMYLLPIFPDDAICMVCGATKATFWVHLIEIIVCRGIGVAGVIFTLELIPSSVSSFTSTNFMDYLRVGIVYAAYTILLFYFARVIDKFLTKKIKEMKK